MCLNVNRCQQEYKYIFATVQFQNEKLSTRSVALTRNYEERDEYAFCLNSFCIERALYRTRCATRALRGLVYARSIHIRFENIRTTCQRVRYV